MAKHKDTLSERFKKFDEERSAKLSRAREHAKLVIPGLLPESGMAEEQDLPVPYAGVPAEGTMNLAARMVSALYPINRIPFLELQINDALVPEGEDTTEESKMLQRFTGHVMDQLIPTNLRSSLFMVEQHLIVIGDVLLFEKNDYSFQLFRLDQYIVKRTPAGEWREIIIEEWVDPEYLPEEVRNFPKVKPPSEVEIGPSDKALEAIYTQIKWNRDEKRWDVKKEFRNKTFDIDTFYTVSPYFPLRWSAVAGENYGRSFVEDMFGDIRVLDALRKALMDGNLMNSEYRWGVNPAGITDLTDFDNSVNGAAIPAVQGDIFAIQAENQAQVAVTLQAVQDSEQRIGRRFLMNSVVQPQGDRVTAEQVRIIAQELEQALGGVLSLQTQDIMIQIARRTMFQMASDEILPPDIAQFIADKDGILKITVRAGLEALRREVDGEKLLSFLQVVGQLPPDAQRRLRYSVLMDRLVLAMGIESTGLVKSDEDIAAEDQAILAQQQAEQAQRVAQQAALEVAKNAPVAQPQETS